MNSLVHVVCSICFLCEGPGKALESRFKAGDFDQQNPTLVYIFPFYKSVPRTHLPSPRANPVHAIHRHAASDPHAQLYLSRSIQPTLSLQQRHSNAASKTSHNTFFNFDVYLIGLFSHSPRSAQSNAIHRHTPCGQHV